MAKFKKGESGNPTGKKPGTLNQVTKEVRTKIESVLSQHFNNEQLAKDLKEAKPYERLSVFLKLLEFVIPKMRSTELKLDFESMTDSDLDIIIAGLIQASKESE